MSFATVAELGNWLDRDLSSKTDEAQLALDVATAQIQAYTRQTIEEVADDTVQLKGTWRHVLELPERPVTSVSSVTVDGEAQTLTDDYVVVRNELRRPNAEYHNWQVPSSDFYPFTKTGWGGPSVIVEVVYTHGYSTIPDDIKGVCLALAGKAFGNPQDARSEQIDDYRIEYSRRAQSALSDYKDVLGFYRRTVRSMSVY